MSTSSHSTANQWPALLGVLAGALSGALAGCSGGDFEVREAEPFARVVPEGASVAKLAGGMEAVEGPVWTDAEGGYLVFSDMRTGRLMRWSSGDGLGTYAERPVPNGNARDAEGRLLTCQHGSRSVVREEADGTLHTLVDSLDGARLNSPNDLAILSDGTIWFTDPVYGLKGREQEVEGNNVYRFDPASEHLEVVVGDFDRPNGIVFSPDEETLYVSDSGVPRHVRAFDIQADGPSAGTALSRDRLFTADLPGPPDGMCCDREGRLYVTAGQGVHVFEPDGRKIGAIRVPEEARNVCFGGSDRRTLFITAGTSLYSVELAVPGA